MKGLKCCVGFNDGFKQNLKTRNKLEMEFGLLLEALPNTFQIHP